MVYFPTEDFTDATFIIVNAGLYYLFLEQHSLTTDNKVLKDEFASHLYTSRVNLETGLANMSLFMSVRIETVQALLLGVRKRFLVMRSTRIDANRTIRRCMLLMCAGPRWLGTLIVLLHKCARPQVSTAKTTPFAIQKKLVSGQSSSGMFTRQTKRWQSDLGVPLSSKIGKLIFHAPFTLRVY
jgi:hypothetical protein